MTEHKTDIPNGEEDRNGESRESGESIESSGAERHIEI